MGKKSVRVDSCASFSTSRQDRRATRSRLVCRQGPRRPIQGGTQRPIRIIAGRRVEIKFSTLWESGLYTFQKIRDQNYEFVVCLRISPFDAHCWVISKSLIRQHAEANVASMPFGFLSTCRIPWIGWRLVGVLLQKHSRSCRNGASQAVKREVK